MDILVGGVVLGTAMVLGNDQYEDPSKYANQPKPPTYCYSYGGSNMASGYGSGIVIYHQPCPPKPKAEKREATTTTSPGK